MCEQAKRTTKGKLAKEWLLFSIILIVSLMIISTIGEYRTLYNSETIQWDNGTTQRVTQVPCQSGDCDYRPFKYTWSLVFDWDNPSTGRQFVFMVLFLAYFIRSVVWAIRNINEKEKQNESN